MQLQRIYKKENPVGNLRYPYENLHSGDTFSFRRCDCSLRQQISDHKRSYSLRFSSFIISLESISVVWYFVNKDEDTYTFDKAFH